MQTVITDYQISYFPNRKLLQQDIPCAVCEAVGRGAALMIPGTHVCPGGWTSEYKGYIVSAHNQHTRTAEFVCMDLSPEGLPGGQMNENGALFNFVTTVCGSLPCPPYIDSREMTCVICSK